MFRIHDGKKVRNAQIKTFNFEIYKNMQKKITPFIHLICEN